MVGVASSRLCAPFFIFFFLSRKTFKTIPLPSVTRKFHLFVVLVGNVPADEGAISAGLRVLRGASEAGYEQQFELDLMIPPGDGRYAQAVLEVLPRSAVASLRAVCEA